MTSPAAASTQRDGTRVYWIPRPDTGEMVDLPSANTVNRVLDAPGITTWKLKAVAQAVGDDEDLAAVARIDPWPAVKEALARNQGAAETGTDVHALTEQLDRGEITIDQVPADLAGYCRGWLRCKDDFGIECLHIERTVFNHDVGYAGTFDRILRIRAIEGTVIGDVKTGKGVWPEAALQMAGYAHGDAMWNPDDMRAEPLPADLRTDVAYAIHLAPDGHYELIPMDLTNAWPAFKAIARAWQWVHREAKHAVGRPLAPPPPPITTTPGIPIEELL